ncbi:hypothetical protein [Actinomadura sp. 9N215]|uniref:hypothetical protein n=1 Tax=Actinomadura sp. 9N215 TaxID=3375150 RepID=UPI0037A625D1
MTDERGQDGVPGERPRPRRGPLRWWRVRSRTASGESAGGESGEDVLRLRRELREARLDLAACERAAERTRTELARARDTAGRDARQRSRADMEQLVAAISTPLAQLMTQAHLHRTGTAEVRAGDVLDVANRLVRGLREAGVDAVGEPGAVEPFDPSRHDPLSAAATGTVAAGRPVVVRVPGLLYEGRIVRKAGVEAETAEAEQEGTG